MRHPYDEDVVEHDVVEQALNRDDGSSRSGDATKPSQGGAFVAQARCTAANKENRFR
jgi:hypothetical protein